MQAIANIGAMTRPQVRNLPTLDLAGAIDNYYDAKDAQTKRLEAEAEKQRRQAYVDELTAAHPEAAAQIAADPVAYAKMLQDNAAAERDQQYKMAQLAQQFNNSLALADRQHANSVGLARMRADLENQAKARARAERAAQLDEALNSGLITQEQYNQAKQRELLGDIVNGDDINMNNPFEKKRIENIAKNMDADIQKSQSTLNKYQQAANLLDNIETGGASGQAKEKAWNMFLTPNEQKFRALANEIMPTMRPTGSGSTSDKDMAVFEKATFGLSKDKEANESIIKGRIAAEENNIAHLQFIAEGYDKGLPLSTLDKMWQQYLDNNRIFNDDGSLNKKRKTAEEYFYGGAPLSVQNSQDAKIQEALAAGYTIEEIQNHLNGGK